MCESNGMDRMLASESTSMISMTGTLSVVSIAIPSCSSSSSVSKSLRKTMVLMMVPIMLASRCDKSISMHDSGDSDSCPFPFPFPFIFILAMERT